MHEGVMYYYQKAIKSGFAHSGKLENETVFLKTFGELSPVCGNPDDFIVLYIRIDKERISEIRYQCIVDPVTNAVMEMICSLLESKTISEAAKLNPRILFEIIGEEDALVEEKATHLLKLINDGIQKKDQERGTCSA